MFTHSADFAKCVGQSVKNKHETSKWVILCRSGWGDIMPKMGLGDIMQKRVGGWYVAEDMSNILQKMWYFEEGVGWYYAKGCVHRMQDLREKGWGDIMQKGVGWYFSKLCMIC